MWRHLYDRYKFRSFLSGYIPDPRHWNDQVLNWGSGSGQLGFHSPFKVWSVIKELRGAAAVSAILYDMALRSGAKVSPEQSVEVDEDHGVHDEHGEQEVAAMLQQREVNKDVIGYVKLST